MKGVKSDHTLVLDRITFLGGGHDPPVHRELVHLDGHIDRFMLPNTTTVLFDDAGILQVTKLLESINTHSIIRS